MMNCLVAQCYNLLQSQYISPYQVEQFRFGKKINRHLHPAMNRLVRTIIFKWEVR